MNKQIIKETNWFPKSASCVDTTDAFTLIDYGCSDGKGRISHYSIFPGIYIDFYDFDTQQIFDALPFHKDIIAICHCKKGRYECEFANQTETYLAENEYAIYGTGYVPRRFSFPLRLFEGVCLIIDKTEIDDRTASIMDALSLKIDNLHKTLKLDCAWYTCKTAPKLEHLFNELYEGHQKESNSYFLIKSMELIYRMLQLTGNDRFDFQYFTTESVQKVKHIHRHLTRHLGEDDSILSIVEQHGMSFSTFKKIFRQIYDDTPYAYIKRYKMNLAAINLASKDVKISTIGAELGYTNPSKFSDAFRSVFGVTPREYRKKIPPQK